MSAATLVVGAAAVLVWVLTGGALGLLVGMWWGALRSAGDRAAEVAVDQALDDLSTYAIRGIAAALAAGAVATIADASASSGPALGAGAAAVALTVALVRVLRDGAR